MPTETLEQEMIRHVAGFVAGSGGERVLGLLKNCIRQAHEEERWQDMLTTVAESKDGSKQLLACAMIGISLSLEIARRAETASIHH